MYDKKYFKVWRLTALTVADPGGAIGAMAPPTANFLKIKFKYLI